MNSEIKEMIQEYLAYKRRDLEGEISKIEQIHGGVIIVTITSDCKYYTEHVRITILDLLAWALSKNTTIKEEE